MNTLPPTIAGIIGLGAPEIAVLVIVFALLMVSPIVLLVGLLVRRLKKDEPGAASRVSRKQCPDCTEFVLAEARV